MIRGSMQVVDLARSASAFRSNLAVWTAQVRSNNRIDQRPTGKPAQLRAIRHVIYAFA